MTVMRTFKRKTPPADRKNKAEVEEAFLQLAKQLNLPVESLKEMMKEETPLKEKIISYEEWKHEASKRLKEIMDHLQDTHEEFGKRFVTTQGETYKRSTIASIMTERQGVTTWMLYQMYEQLGISPSWFLSGRYEDERYEGFMKKYLTEMSILESRIRSLEEENKRLLEKLREGG